MFKYYELLLPPAIKGLTKSKLWKVKGILENGSSWNSQTYYVLKFQEHYIPKHRSTFCPLKTVVTKFKKNNERLITYDNSKIVVQYLWRSSLFVNLQAYSLHFYQKTTSFTVFFFKDFPYFLILSLGTLILKNTCEGLLPDFCFFVFV